MIKKNPQSGNTIVIADDHLNSFMNELYDADNKVALSFVENGMITATFIHDKEVT
jgi:hypothetical protein